MWFERLMGFEEFSPENVRLNTYIKNEQLVSKINGNSYQFGRLEIPRLSELREQYGSLEFNNCKLSINEIVEDVQKLHCTKENGNALFQVASQFNLLEMVGPHISPEKGVDIYENDYTQGPTCAIACGAGTIYRNYYAEVNGNIGQTSTSQIDCLSEIGKKLNNEELKLWQMKNGYALLSKEGLLKINKELNWLTNTEKEELKGELKVGIQWNTEVTLEELSQLVSQVYCSALPVGYSQIESYYFENFARLILEATYEATLYIALENLKKTGCNKVFLTLVGGGVFQNELSWILDSIYKALIKFKNVPLDVKVVSYGGSNSYVQQLIQKLQ